MAITSVAVPYTGHDKVVNKSKLLLTDKIKLLLTVLDSAEYPLLNREIMAGLDGRASLYHEGPESTASYYCFDPVCEKPYGSFYNACPHTQFGDMLTRRLNKLLLHGYVQRFKVPGTIETSYPTGQLETVSYSGEFPYQHKVYTYFSAHRIVDVWQITDKGRAGLRTKRPTS